MFSFPNDVTLVYHSIFPNSIPLQGYLKISIMVMGPGDDMKHSPPDMSPEDIDIEA